MRYVLVSIANYIPTEVGVIPNQESVWPNQKDYDAPSFDLTSASRTVNLGLLAACWTLAGANH